MASTIFDVTPEELEASATKIEGKTSEFVKTYNGIYTAVSDLSVTYKARPATRSTKDRRLQERLHRSRKSTEKLCSVPP